MPDVKVVHINTEISAQVVVDHNRYDAETVRSTVAWVSLFVSHCPLAAGAALAPHAVYKHTSGRSIPKYCDAESCTTYVGQMAAHQQHCHRRTAAGLSLQGQHGKVRAAHASG